MTEDPDAGENTFKVFSVIQEVYLHSRLNTTFLIDTTLLIEFTSVVSARELFIKDHHLHCQVRNSTWYVVYTSIPALAAGLCFKPFKKEEILNNPAIYNVLIFLAVQDSSIGDIVSE